MPVCCAKSSQHESCGGRGKHHAKSSRGPVTKAAHPDGQEDFVDLSPGAGAAKWRIYDLPSNLVYEMHHTDTVDFDVVADGSMTLVLDRDEVIPQPGDGVLLAGDRHSRRAGSRGCRILFALLGTPETP